jgi:hypothetical protein
MNAMIRKLLACGFASVLLAAAASAGPLTPESRKEIDRLMDVVVIHPTFVATQYFTMRAGEVISVPFTADATIEYYVNVICDEDCVNVDLVGREADGTEADTDDFDDAGPVLNLQASEYRSPIEKPNGTPVRPMTLEIRMIACNTDVCSLGLRITRVEDWKAGEDDS